MSSNSDYTIVGTSPVRHDGVEKVTGRAAYGADFSLPGMLFGKVLRSEHAHARIRSIDTSSAKALEGVLCVITGDDFPIKSTGGQTVGKALTERDTAHNVMARRHARYHGHAVAAVAATSPTIAQQALALISVDYEPLPHVTDVMEAVEGKVIIDEALLTDGEMGTGPTNVAKHEVFERGDIGSGFDSADVVMEREYDSATVHQGYIEPHACVARVIEDGQVLLWVSSQGQFAMRDLSANALEIPASKIRAVPAEIGGGFGGKTTIYLEPLAILMAQRTGRPVKMWMTRDEVFRATGPAPGSHIRLKMGITNEGDITAVDCDMWFEAGAYPGSAYSAGMKALLAPYDVDTFRVNGFDVLVNKPKSAAYRAPGAPNASHACESLVDELCKEISMDPLDFRMRNAARKGTKQADGPAYPEIGMVETVEAAKAHEHYHSKLGPNQGRGVASGWWVNAGGEATAHIVIQPDGRPALVTGRPDIGGSRASQAMILAEELGIDVGDVKPMIGDTDSVGFNMVTGGSSVAYAAGLAVHEATQKLIEVLRERAALIWDADASQVEWRNGAAHAKGRDSLSLRELAEQAGPTGGPIAADANVNARGAAAAFGTHICDIEVDPETGKVDVIRYTVCQDAGRAIHRAYVEGQFQGGAAQGIGWALNEEYIYNQDGVMENAGFLDYRMPVALDLPMIEAVIVEVPNPKHPYGIRGVGENGIVAPLAAVANAIADATGARLYSVPMTPPKVQAAIAAHAGRQVSGASREKERTPVGA